MVSNNRKELFKWDRFTKRMKHVTYSKKIKTERKMFCNDAHFETFKTTLNKETQTTMTDLKPTSVLKKTITFDASTDTPCCWQQEQYQGVI